MKGMVPLLQETCCCVLCAASVVVVAAVAVASAVVAFAAAAVAESVASSAGVGRVGEAVQEGPFPARSMDLQGRVVTSYHAAATYPRYVAGIYVNKFSSKGNNENEIPYLGSQANACPYLQDRALV
jgi:hypothetical protein